MIKYEKMLEEFVFLSAKKFLYGLSIFSRGENSEFFAFVVPFLGVFLKKSNFLS